MTTLTSCVHGQGRGSHTIEALLANDRYTSQPLLCIGTFQVGQTCDRVCYYFNVSLRTRFRVSLIDFNPKVQSLVVWDRILTNLGMSIEC